MLEAHAVPYIIVARLTTALKRRLHSSALVWRDLGKGYAVSSFTLKLHGWSDTRLRVSGSLPCLRRQVANV